MGRRHLSLAVALAIILPFLISASAGEAKNSDLNKYENINVAKLVLEKTSSINSVEVVENEVHDEQVETEELKRPNIPDIPLDNKLLDYIWMKSQDNNFSYELLLAMAKVESNFKANTESHTNDSGLFQINRTTGKWIASELGLNRYNLSDPYVSTDFAVYYLNTLRDAWINKGLSEEELYDVIVISYNRGVAGANKYIKKYGAKNNTYLKKVSEYKKIYEMGE